MRNSFISKIRGFHKTSKQLTELSVAGSQTHVERVITASTEVSRTRQVFRTTDDDPNLHTLNHVGLHYKISNDDLNNRLRGTLRPSHRRLMKTFNENCLMVRQPSLEVNGYLKTLNHKHPIPRFLYYGNQGAGTGTCMALNIHYCSLNDWVIVHLPWAGRLIRVNEWHPKKQALESSFRPGRLDVAEDAVEILTQFRIQNQASFKKLDLKTTQEYIWTKREKADVGTPLDEIINFGLNRFKFAADVVGVLFKELRQQASTKGFKVLVSVGGINALFVPWDAKNCIKKNVHTKIHPSELTMIHHFKRMLTPNWCGGAAIGNLIKQANNLDSRESILPRYLLQQDGFEHLDPFVPIHVPEYSEKEARSVIEYFIDRNWLQHEKANTEQGIQELLFVSQRNGFDLQKTCAGK